MTQPGTALRDVAASLRTASEAPPFEPIRSRLADAGVGDATLRKVVQRVTHVPATLDELCALRERVVGSGPAGDSPGLFEQYVLIRAALSSLPEIPGLPLPGAVKEMLLDEYHWMALPPEAQRGWMRAGTYEFSALAKLATLRRFPAGQLHWEVDGMPRSMLWRVRRRDLPRLLKGLVLLGGFRPTFVPHLAWRREHDHLLEEEHRRSFRLMAEALRLQPRVRGVFAEAWYYSPDTARVSPHLAWASRLFEEGGGVTVVSGVADETSGVFARSRTRRRLAAEGRYQPTLGLGLWPRTRLIRWASAQSAR